jgi:hypothetical protein
MPQTTIDTNLFTNGTEPWPNQVFQQDFDAYFLLSYPPFQFQKTEVHNPFSFMNNLGEYTVYVQTPDGSNFINHHMPVGQYDYQIFYDKLNATLSEERFLLWEGERGKWAMVSDGKHKVCVLATDWKTASQVEMFYSQCLLSPKQFLEIVGLEKHERIFLKNYAPSKNLIDGNMANPIWRKYYFQCHVEDENDKLFYWPQFEQLYNATSALLKPCKGIDLYACQAFDRRYWQNKQWYSSGSFAPVGGWQNFNLKNCEKVATKFLTQNAHLVLAFEGKKEESEALIIANKKGLIAFYGFMIYANREKQKTKGGAADFVFNMELHGHSNKDVVHNQNFEFFFKEDLLEADAIEKYVEALKTFCHVRLVHEVRQPSVYAIYTADKPLQIHGIYAFVPALVKLSHPLYNRF